MKVLRTIGRSVRDAWLIVGITLLVFVLIEGGLRLASSVKQQLATRPASADDTRALTDAYGEATWPAEYEAEFDRSYSVRWQPYVYWRRNAFRGEHINVDTNGVRLTATPTHMPESAAPLRVFMFGGSTMWGTGARDAFTIPSIVARELVAAGIAAEVTNFGETGYVSTQGVLALLQELRKGNVPALVVFYDGVNDAFSAYQQGVAGIPQNEHNRVHDFNLSRLSAGRQRRILVMQDLSRGLHTVELSRRLLRRTGLARNQATAGSPSNAGQPARDDELADAVVAAYRINVDIVRALGERHGFESLFYWQPTVFDKPHLTDLERVKRAEMEFVAPFFQRTNAAIRRSVIANDDAHAFFDVSDIFADTHEPVFVDWCHLRESGNAIIAGRMASDIITRRRNRRGARR